MLKAFLLVVVSLLLFSLWIIEPASYNPLEKVPPSLSQSSIHYACGEASEAALQDSADNIIDEYVEAGQFLGVSAGLYKQHCGTYIAGAGYSSKRGQAKATGTMISRVASVTKPMTAIAIMQLYEQGLVDLDAPIHTYLPGFANTAGQSITTRQLLSHTSGIPHYTSKLDAISFAHYESLSEALEKISIKPLSNNPGEVFSYSSYGYTVLGAIVESVSGLEFENYLSENIWQVAGMINTNLERVKESPGKSRLYIKINSTYIRSPYTDLSIIYPAGGVQSTAGDLLKFGQAILDNKLVRRETLEMMIDVSESLAPAAGDDPYGLGWVVYNNPEHGRVIAHSGAQPGASAYFEILLDSGVVVATLSNAFGTKSSSNQLAREMAALVL